MTRTRGLNRFTRLVLAAVAVTVGSLVRVWASEVAADPELRSDALRPPSSPGSLSGNQPGGRLFQTLDPATSGVDFVCRWNPGSKYEKLLNSSAAGGGVAIGDYDGDGLPDICLTRPFGGCRLYRNLGGFRFTNVTEQAGLHTDGFWTTGVTFVDVDNDGLLDLYVCCYDAPNQLYINRGHGVFEEQAKAYGLDFNGASLMASFGDFDRDGLLDVYILTGALPPRPDQKFRVKFVDGKPVVPEELQEVWQILYTPGDKAAVAEAGQLDHLYRNNGNRSFTEVSKAAGIRGCEIGNSAIWWDSDGDGWPDLYVANDYFGADHLYRNNRDGTFTDVAKEALPHTPWTSMGADAGDLNNDGLLDLIASDMSGTTRSKRIVDMGDMEKSGWFLELPDPRQYMRNAVYLNTGTPRFMEVAYWAGLANTDWTWSILLADLDSDGRLDVFVPNGMTRDWMDNDLALQARALPPTETARFWQKQPMRRDLNLAFRNDGDMSFSPVGHEWGLDHAGPSFGAAAADLDGDGRLDLVINDFEAPTRVCRNLGVPGRHCATVRLVGGRSNRMGLGATVRVEAGSGMSVRYATLAHGFMSASEPVLHFGLGTSETIGSLAIEWPSGARQSFADLKSDRAYTIVEPVAASGPDSKSNKGKGVSSQAPSVTNTTMFTMARPFGDSRYDSEPIDEFSRQSLLPFKLGLAGPGIACADVNGDGREDVYFVGTPHKPGMLFFGDGVGGFKPALNAVPSSGAEEMAPLFLDVNGDGWLDLFVTTAGVGCDPASPLLRDLLYFNDGHGRFVSAPPGSLPDLRDSGSCVVAADFDHDGDLDLFVGTLCVPGKFPAASASHLLRNDGGKFVDATSELAPGLAGAGLVTSAVWSDVDNDGWVDLLVACEWGPVRLFWNDHGRLVEHTREAGLAALTGLWSGIAAADVDNDGDIDLVVGNLGLNTRYLASAAAPFRIYYGDFAGTGDDQLVEAEMEDGRWVPTRGRSALERAIPRIGATFPTHHGYAAASVADLLGPEAAKSASFVEANTLEAGVFLNDGKGRFQFKPLPRMAQASASFGLAVADFDGDGSVDVCLAQNTAAPQRETGRIDGGVGLLALGKGDGTFACMWPSASGIVVSEDGRSLAVCDVNGDGRPDMLLGVNGGQPVALINRVPVPTSSTWLLLKLLSNAQAKGNRDAVGARVTVVLKGGGRRVAEVACGGGYLSQSSALLRFALPSQATVERVDVQWPDGTRSTHSWGTTPTAGSPLTLQQP